MPINIHIDDDIMSLRDAIAYEFYMDNLSGYMEDWKNKNNPEEREDIGVALAKLATAAFTVAEVFCIARDDILDAQSTEQINDTNA